ncbi:MAG: hydrogen peroxide-inducible genes activator [Tannerella sp.]|jgi:LysR family hydrogen peroxide-inducible transcriptional activator|nr:hydrogen peroxide-inducible genes activator [Tannerella sp.]
MNINIQQLEYVVAVDTYRHFARAAESCFVTQPTLSMMIQKLEDELNIKIFDRSTHPVEPTPIGRQIIEQARIALRHFRQIKEIADNERNIVKGAFRLGIIPTIAPYLIPELLRRQNETRNEITLTLHENTTAQIIKKLQNGTLDGGLMAGPLYHDKLTEYPVYYEKFYAYVSPEEKIYAENEVDLDSIDINRIWLLENEHCLRGQVEHLCQMKQKAKNNSPAVQYEAGSIDTLIHVVDHNGGMTIIPEMSAMRLSEEQQVHLRNFKNTSAYREASLMVSNDYVRKSMLNEVLNIIRASVPRSMQDVRLKEFVVELGKIG